jgi:hypothetical protein
MVAKVRERLAVNKQRSQRFNTERLNLKKVNNVKGKVQCLAEVSNMFEALEDLEDLYAEVDINSTWESVN